MKPIEVNDMSKVSDAVDQIGYPVRVSSPVLPGDLFAYNKEQLDKYTYDSLKEGYNVFFTEFSQEDLKKVRGKSTEGITEIMLDMDGVLADFERRVSEIVGKPFDEIEEKEKWKTTEREGFFASIPPMADMEDLLLHVAATKIPTFVLTAAGDNNYKKVVREKAMWISWHVLQPSLQGVFFTRKSREKCRLATPNTLLIDDRPKAMDPWLEAGGVGILHTDAASTIKQLRNLLDK